MLEEKACGPPTGMVTTEPPDAAASVCICSAQRSEPRHVWFSSLCRSHSSISGAVSQRVSRIVDGIATLSPRLQALGCHVHFEQQLGAYSWKLSSAARHVLRHAGGHYQRLRLGLRDPQGSLFTDLGVFFLTTSPEIIVWNIGVTVPRERKWALCSEYFGTCAS